MKGMSPTSTATTTAEVPVLLGNGVGADSLQRGTGTVSWAVTGNGLIAHMQAATADPIGITGDPTHDDIERDVAGIDLTHMPAVVAAVALAEAVRSHDSGRGSLVDVDNALTDYIDALAGAAQKEYANG